MGRWARKVRVALLMSLVTSVLYPLVGHIPSAAAWPPAHEYSVGGWPNTYYGPTGVLDERQDLSAISDNGYAVIQDEWVLMAANSSAWIELGTCSGTGGCGSSQPYGSWFYEYGYNGNGHVVYDQAIGGWNQWHYFDFYFYYGYWYPYVDSTNIGTTYIYWNQYGYQSQAGLETYDIVYFPAFTSYNLMYTWVGGNWTYWNPANGQPTNVGPDMCGRWNNPNPTPESWEAGERTSCP